MFAVRDATTADADAIAALHTASWQVAYRGIYPDALLDSPRFVRERRDRWRAWRPSPGAPTLVVVDDEAVLGFASLGPERGEPDRIVPQGRGELYAFYLHPDVWGGGSAPVLMDAAVERLRALGYTIAVLWVLRDNPRARRFYERSGWHVTGEVGFFGSVGDVSVEEVEYARRL